MTEETTRHHPPAASPDEPPEKSGPLVVGIDGSVNAEVAALWAAAEAERRDTPLVVVHAMADPGVLTVAPTLNEWAARRRADGRALLDRTVAGLRTHHPGLTIHAELPDHSPAAALTELSHTAALVVTGSRGHGGFTGMLVGSVSRRLASHAACPLVVVHAAQPREAEDEVVLGVGHKPAPDAVAYAFEAARRLNAELTVIRAWWPRADRYATTALEPRLVGEPDTIRQEAMESTYQAVADIRADYPDVELHVHIRPGNAVDALVGAARDARLLVVGAHRPRGPLSTGAGYVVEGVIAHSPAPVAVVPAD